MNRWVSVRVGMPNNEIECVVAQIDTHSIKTYPKFAEWDGESWVDIDGEVVPDVVAWTKAPIYDNKADNVLMKLKACVENDKCENKDCGYFVALDLLETLLEYK